MKKKIIICTSIIILLLCLVSLLIRSNKVKSDIYIKLYKPGTEEIINTVYLTDNEDITTLEKYIKTLAPLSSDEQVDLTLLQEIEINYKDIIIVGIQQDEEMYCYYKNIEEKVSGLSRMPYGLYEFIKRKINF